MNFQYIACAAYPKITREANIQIDPQSWPATEGSPFVYNFKFVFWTFLMSDLVRSIGSITGEPIDLDNQRRELGAARSAMTEIHEIRAREILDSRGNPTVEAE